MEFLAIVVSVVSFCLKCTLALALKWTLLTPICSTSKGWSKSSTGKISVMVSLMKSREKEAYTRSDKVCKQRFNPFARRGLFFQPLELFSPLCFLLHSIYSLLWFKFPWPSDKWARLFSADLTAEFVYTCTRSLITEQCDSPKNIPWPPLLKFM